MFDKDLFYSLCEKYEVELSDKYDTAMIKEKTDLKELNADELKRVFSDLRSRVPYEESSIKAIVQSSIFRLEEYPTAC